MRQLVVPKRNRPIEKVKKENDKLETTEELPNLGELYAPLTWTERLRRVVNIDIGGIPARHLYSELTKHRVSDA